MQETRCYYISALMLTCFRLKKGRAKFFRPETIVASFLRLMVLSFKVLSNHSSKRQFLVLNWRLDLYQSQIYAGKHFFFLHAPSKQLFTWQLSNAICVCKTCLTTILLKHIVNVVIVVYFSWIRWKANHLHNTAFSSCSVNLGV